MKIMKVMTSSTVGYVAVGDEKAGVVVPIAGGAPAPCHYAYSTLDGEVVLHGTQPDGWVLERGGNPEDAVGVFKMSNCSAQAVLFDLTAHKPGSGSVGGWKVADDQVWADEVEPLVALCRLPSWLVVVAEVIPKMAPVVRWAEVAERLVRDEQRAGVEVTLAPREWDQQSQVEWSALDASLGLKIACVEGGLGLEVTVTHVIYAPPEEVQAPVNKPANKPVNKPEQTVVWQSPPTPVPVPESHLEKAMRVVEPELHYALRVAFVAELARAGGSMTSSAQRRAVNIALNAVRKGVVQPPAPVEDVKAEPPAKTTLSVVKQAEQELEKAEEFLELDPSLRVTAAARVAAGETTEEVVLDLLTAPVAVPKPRRKAKA